MHAGFRAMRRALHSRAVVASAVMGKVGEEEGVDKEEPFQAAVHNATGMLLRRKVEPTEHTHQPHPPEHGDAVDALHAEVDEAGHHDDEVEDVPSGGEVVLAERHQLEHGLQGEEGGEDLVADVEHVLEVLAHAVVLGRQEGSVEDDAEGDGAIEHHVMDHQEERVLEAQP